MSLRAYNSLVVPASFWQKVDQRPDGCWLWTASVGTTGYGQVTLDGHKGLKAHRVAYAALAEPLIEGLVLHHTCGNRRCVNPAHLIQLTRRSHILIDPQGAPEANRRKTHCPQGHPYTGRNLVQKPGEGGRRRCRTCLSDAERRRRAHRNRNV